MNDLDTRRTRAAHNQSLFREVNERISVLSSKYVAESPTVGYVCECLDMSCAESVQLAHDEYERLRRDDNQFFVAPGHEDRTVEEVIEANDRYLVVKKLGVGAEVAEKLA
ncbi:MAG TPA: hypothetical protein VLJ44_12210 [Gaiellaceae bacterium]|nr:hypothetical protein [Gaiellaceae bacterium]